MFAEECWSTHWTSVFTRRYYTSCCSVHAAFFITFSGVRGANDYNNVWCCFLFLQKEPFCRTETRLDLCFLVWHWITAVSSWNIYTRFLRALPTSTVRQLESNEYFDSWGITRIRWTDFNVLQHLFCFLHGGGEPYYLLCPRKIKTTRERVTLPHAHLNSL